MLLNGRELLHVPAPTQSRTPRPQTLAEVRLAWVTGQHLDYSNAYWKTCRLLRDHERYPLPWCRETIAALTADLEALDAWLTVPHPDTPPAEWVEGRREKERMLAQRDALQTRLNREWMTQASVPAWMRSSPPYEHNGTQETDPFADQ